MKLSGAFNRTIEKRDVWVPLILTLIISMAQAVVPVHAGHTNEHFWVEPAVTPGKPVNTTFTVEVWIENAWDMVGWAMSVHVDPDVLEVLNAVEGTFLSDFLDLPPHWCLETSFIPGVVNKTTGYIIDTSCMIISWWEIPDGEAASGSGMLCKYEFKSKSETAYSLIDLFDVRVYDHTQPLYIENVTDGHYNQPEVPAPDLYIEGILLPYLTPVPLIYPNPDSGFAYQINVTVSNQGTADADSFNVSFAVHLDGQLMPEYGRKKTVGSLQQGANKTFAFDFRPQYYGNYTLTITADCDNDIVELNETNNIKTTWVIGTITGDIGGDGYVGPDDYWIFAGDYGKRFKSPPYLPSDLDYDGYVGPHDHWMLSGNYGATVPPQP